jgi:hypothetical protein
MTAKPHAGLFLNARVVRQMSAISVNILVVIVIKGRIFILWLPLATQWLVNSRVLPHLVGIAAVILECRTQLIPWGLP